MNYTHTVSRKDKEVVKIKKIGNINLLELYHGPTLAFKDIAMQVIGNMYDQLKVAEKKSVNVVVATSGDTGSAAIAALCLLYTSPSPRDVEESP